MRRLVISGGLHNPDQANVVIQRSGTARYSEGASVTKLRHGAAHFNFKAAPIEADPLLHAV